MAQIAASIATGAILLGAAGCTTVRVPGTGATPSPGAAAPTPSAEPTGSTQPATPVSSRTPSPAKTGGGSGGPKPGSGGGSAGSGSSTPPAVSGCPAATVPVSTAEELADALADARPGDVIGLANGVYQGEFVTTASGTSGKPIYLCGSRSAVLDGGSVTGGYVFHLNGASYWRLVGFSVTNGQKGVMADGTTGSVIQALAVSHIGDEAIHLRRNSTKNSVVGNTISDTGLRREKFGEGVYIGTAESNWCDITKCQPDNSDYNLVEGNTISATTAEAVDIKEGTSHGTVRGNRFDGSSLSGADSWVDVKGNDWLIESNVGTDSPQDGFQTHEILDGWGTRNVFRGNTANVNGPGFGYSLTPVRDNVVTCDNRASGAGEGLSNVPCS